jgi:hypothetical protein
VQATENPEILSFFLKEVISAAKKSETLILLATPCGFGLDPPSAARPSEQDTVTAKLD